jgi:hypothetical protein
MGIPTIENLNQSRRNPLATDVLQLHRIRKRSLGFVRCILVEPGKNAIRRRRVKQAAWRS